MKIIQVSASYKPAFVYGGPTMSVSKLSEELYKSSINVSVLTTLANGKNELNFPAGKTTFIEDVPVKFFKRITKDHSHFSPALIIHLLKQKKTSEPTVVHIHAWWNLVSILSCQIAQLKNIPVVLSPRGTLSNYSFSKKHNKIKSWMHFLWGKKLLFNCYLHVTSEAEKKEIVQLLHPKKIQVIPNFVNFPTEFNLKKPNDSSTLKVLFLSRIEPKKGLEILINALADIDFPYQLSIAGNGEPDYIVSLQNLIAKNSMQQLVSWIGFQQNETKFRVLHDHDLLVLPSYNENFANVVIESLAVGTAVLISNNVGLADYVIENHLGWTFENNPEKLRKQLFTIYQNRNQLDKIRSKSPRKIREDFAEEVLIKQYIRFYQEVINDYK